MCDNCMNVLDVNAQICRCGYVFESGEMCDQDDCKSCDLKSECDISMEDLKEMVKEIGEIAEKTK